MRRSELPLIGRFLPAPVAAKVPEVIFVFWVVKILTTAGGEATSDYLKTYGNFGGGGLEVLVIVVGLALQFGTRRYRAFAYWSLAFAIAITGTGVSDFLHLDVHIPYAGTTLLWAVILAAIFWVWKRSEGTLSIHSITTLTHPHPASQRKTDLNDRSVAGGGWLQRREGGDGEVMAHGRHLVGDGGEVDVRGVAHLRVDRTPVTA